jgi:hypothetical protein
MAVPGRRDAGRSVAESQPGLLWLQHFYWQRGKFCEFAYSDFV